MAKKCRTGAEYLPKNYSAIGSINAIFQKGVQLSDVTLNQVKANKLLSWLACNLPKNRSDEIVIHFYYYYHYICKVKRDYFQTLKCRTEARAIDTLSQRFTSFLSIRRQVGQVL